MTTQILTPTLACKREEIFAYLDNELSAEEELALENHLAHCKSCTDELNAQKKVSNSLEIVLDEEMNNIEIPENFSHVVKTRAESSMIGLRRKREISRSFWIIFGLVVAVALFGIGVGSIVSGFKVEKQNAEGGIFHTFQDTVFGAVAIFRTIGHKYFSGNVLVILLIGLSLVVAFLILNKLLSRNLRS
ncbi:MAG: anti-sigma factor family protein [Pyrinomonadaceae bacterium]